MSSSSAQHSSSSPDQSARRVAETRKLTEAQRHLWQQVPWLALQAIDPSEETLALTPSGQYIITSSGVSFALEQLGLAYAGGLWPVGLDTDEMMYTAYVDCATGRLVDAEDPTQPAPDDAVLAVADSPLLDAAAVIAALKIAIAARGAADPHAAWRRAEAAELGLAPPPPARGVEL